MKKISKEKKYRTVSGKKVKIYEIYDSQVHGAVFYENFGKWLSHGWDLCGETDFLDLSLIEVEEPKIGDLCWFSDCEDFSGKSIGSLLGIDDYHEGFPYKCSRDGKEGSLYGFYKYCKPCDEDFNNYKRVEDH